MTTPRTQRRLPDPPVPSDGFTPHGTREEVVVSGVVVPGLRAAFHRRPEGDRTETVGVYSYGGRQLFVAWGYVGEPHCRFNALRRDEAGWHETRRGCPVLRPIREDGAVTGLTVLAGGVLVPFRLTDLMPAR